MISLSAEPSSVSFGPAAVTFHARVNQNANFFEYFSIGEEALVIATVTSRNGRNESLKNTLPQSQHKDASGYLSVGRATTFQHLGVEIDEGEFEALRCAVIADLGSSKSLMWEISFDYECVSKAIRDDVWKLIGEPRISLGETE